MQINRFDGQSQMEADNNGCYENYAINLEFNLSNKVLLYDAVRNPIWTYGIQKWGTSSHSNIEIILRNDLWVLFVMDEAKDFSARYLNRLSDHVNRSAIFYLFYLLFHLCFISKCSKKDNILQRI